MPRFYFHLHNDIDAPDGEGLEFANLEAAKAHALTMVRFTAAETVKEHGHFVRHHRVDIEDENGAVLGTVPFDVAVTIKD